MPSAIAGFTDQGVLIIHKVFRAGVGAHGSEGINAFSGLKGTDSGVQKDHMLSTYLSLGYAGIAVVVFSIAVFIMFRNIKRGETATEDVGWRVILYALYASAWGLGAACLLVAGAVFVLVYPFIFLAKRLAPKEVSVEVPA
jgi:hypothetical protein